MKMNTCESCKFFRQNDGTSGICCWKPPVPFLTAPDKILTVWPSVQLAHWCGEWAIRLVIAKELPPDPRQIVQ